MKKMIKSILALFLVFTSLVGCKKEEPKTEEKEEVVTVTYRESANPTSLLNKIYEDLKEADENEEKEEVEYAAAYFAADFFTWSNKKEREDIGGVYLVLPEVRESFASYALRDYYVNFAELKEQYGSEQLPEVKDYEIISNEESAYIYEGDTKGNDIRDITIELTYKRSKAVDVDTLKSETTITMMKTDSIWYVVGVDYQNVK